MPVGDWHGPNCPCRMCKDFNWGQWTTWNIPPQVWIVGIVKVDLPHYWEFVGVFDSEERAVSACLTWEYFVAPYQLNEAQPYETTDGMAGAYYPLAGETPPPHMDEPDGGGWLEIHR